MFEINKVLFTMIIRVWQIFQITVTARGRRKADKAHGRKTESLIWLCGNQDRR